jgi:hypothetical protein
MFVAPLVETNHVCSESCPCDRVGDDCNYLAYSEDTGQCLKFTPPPKVCRGVELIGPILHKGNINNFVDCEVVQGSIHIDHLSFTKYVHTSLNLLYYRNALVV